jgi:DNA-binding CsgD family transcriptional regulator
VSYLSDYRAPRSLKEICGAPEYFSAIASLLEHMAVQSSAPELVLALRAATSRLGADASFFASFLREDKEFDSFRFLVGCDPVWAVEYEWKRCVAADPWLRYAKRHTEPVLSTHVKAANEQEQQTIELASRHGFRSAFIVPAPVGSGSRIGVLVLGSRQSDFFDDAAMSALKALARGVAMQLHERFAEVMQRDLQARCDLTSLDLELLAHQRDGRPSKVIAAMMGCSVGAIDQRFHRLYAKLGVANRAQAAGLVAAYGLI